ncbi:MAG: PASTA domain-containing protein [Clostridiales bacterium]|nr:PASTA domain-containing protein [Clostridiales bacterium]
MNRQKRKKSSSRQANRRIFRRTVFLLAACGIVMFIPVVYKLWYWQISRHDEIEQKAVEQQTSELSVSALRGTIYDSEGNVLAISASAYDVILSPKAISEKQQELDAAAAEAQEKGEDPGEVMDVVETIATGLAEILDDVEADDIREKCQDTTSQYKKIATKLDATTEEEVREFMDEYSLSRCVYLTPNSKRYYPYSTLAAQIIGFANDNGGAYGIEAELEDDLSGTAGLVVTAQNASGTDLLNFYQEYYDAESGSTVTLTLSTEIQKLCEDALADGVEKYDAQNGGFIIVMECDTGAILGMASSPTYDLNDYSTVIDSVLQEEVESGEITKSEALNEMWRNKALNDTYEPGSTFKSLVLAAALQEGVVSEETTFNCTGSVTVSDWTIRCSDRSGHGLQTLAEAVGNSCNPAFISIGQSLGTETFYSYMERFGLMDSTGIDLPGESANVIWDLSSFGITELATASFGQRFTVTPISLITAINAVVNGGYLYTPHVVQSIVDTDGDTTYEADTTAVRQVISEETSQRCATILEGVVTSFTGRNAYMSGYRIGGKTGTSQTLVDDEYIVSFVGFAPADDPEIIVLVAFDSPQVDAAGSNYSTTGYYISGGNMAAPVAGQLIADILDYLGYEKQYTDDDLSGVSVSMPALTGLSESEAAEALEAKDLTYRVVGDGETVTDQCPASGSTLPSGSEVILYMGEEAPDDTVTVPDLTGMTVDQAKEALSELDLYMTATGSSSYYNSTTLAYSQSTAAGTEVERGSVITVNFADSAVADYAGQEIDD